MNKLSDLLQDADPLRHEPPLADSARARIRQDVLRAVPAPRSSSMWTRLPLAATLTAVITAVAAIGYVVSNFAATPVMTAVRLEIRLAEERPAPGLVVAATPGSDRLIYLHPAVVLGNDDIAQSWVVDDGSGKFGVGLEFLPEGAARVRQATAGHVGRPMAVLVDGLVVLAPIVRSAIDQSAVITGEFTRAEAERIANGVR